MSDTDPTTNGGETDPQQPTIADLRNAADEGTKAKRELAFVKAGIDTDTPLGKMFSDAYKGQLDKDAIQAAWSEVAPKVEPAVEAQAQADAEAQQQQEAERQAAQDRARRGIATTPAEPPQEPTADVLEGAYTQFQANMREGLSREAAAKPVFEAIIGAAANGDERFIWNGEWTDEELREGRVSRA